jgi:hypothetical protein
MPRLNATYSTANAALIAVALDPEFVHQLLIDSLLALHRICTTGMLDRGDASILSAWEEIWSAMDADQLQLLEITHGQSHSGEQ